MSNITVKFIHFFQLWPQLWLHRMAEFEKEGVEFPVCHLEMKGTNIIWQHFILFDFIIYIFQLYKGDCTITQIYWALALSSTEQIVVGERYKSIPIDTNPAYPKR